MKGNECVLESAWNQVAQLVEGTFPLERYDLILSYCKLNPAVKDHSMYMTISMNLLYESQYNSMPKRFY